LKFEEEKQLLQYYLKNNDLNSAHKLVTAHLRLVVSIAIKFRGYGLPLMDLIAEGNIGLMKAIKRFKLQKGTRLSTYAIWWIKAMIQDYILKSWSMLKINSSVLQKRLFSNVNKLKKKIFINDRNSYINNANFQTISLNNRLSNDSYAEISDIIADQNITADDFTIKKEEKAIRSNALKTALIKLSNREREIIKQRKLVEKPITLNELSKKFHVSSERIRQIEEKALNKLRHTICSATVK
jgi:RNA polymerase sigma-32 factor